MKYRETELICMQELNTAHDFINSCINMHFFFFFLNNVISYKKKGFHLITFM